MGIEVKGYKLGGGSLTADLYVQLGRNPIATQRKSKLSDSGAPLADQWIYETIYVAVAHGSREDKDHITVVKQGGVRTDQPVTGDVYALCYKSLKEELIKDGYTTTDVQ